MIRYRMSIDYFECNSMPVIRYPSNESRGLSTQYSFPSTVSVAYGGDECPPTAHPSIYPSSFEASGKYLRKYRFANATVLNLSFMIPPVWYITVQIQTFLYPTP